MNNLQAIRSKVEKQLSALAAEEYRITLQNDNKSFIFCNRLLQMSEILDEKKLFILDKKNMREKMNVYVTPISQLFDFYLIDDVSNEELQKVEKQYNICCLMKTSETFQVVIKTEKLDMPGQVKNDFFKQLNSQYGDPKISGYPHSFRLANFKNVKRKYLNVSTGYYPFISLIFSKNETCKKSETKILELLNSTESNSVGLQHSNKQANSNSSTGELQNKAAAFYAKMQKQFIDVDYSRADFTLLKILVDRNVDIDTAIDAIRQQSPNLAKRHKNIERYLQTTKDNFLLRH